MKGEQALLLTRRTHAFFEPTSCPALSLLVGLFRHRLFFPIPPPQWKGRCFLNQQRRRHCRACQVCPAKSAFLLSLISSHTHLTNASPHGLEYIYCEG